DVLALRADPELRPDAEPVLLAGRTSRGAHRLAGVALALRAIDDLRRRRVAGCTFRTDVRRDELARAVLGAEDARGAIVRGVRLGLARGLLARRQRRDDDERCREGLRARALHRGMVAAARAHAQAR